MNFDGLSGINVELTSRCNKNCWCCGRRKIEKDYRELTNWGDMPEWMVESIASQIPSNIVVQLHNNGEPLLYDKIGWAILQFSNQITSFDTNGKLLIKKADEIIGNVDSIAISVIQNDSEKESQLNIIKEFLRIKGSTKPLVVVRLNGEQDDTPYKDLGVIIARRVIHNPMGSFDYSKNVTIPEIGICLEVLHHMLIDRFGNVRPCVRFDPYNENIIGNINNESLCQIWNSEIRKSLIDCHVSGNRNTNSFCSKCEYWGCPTGW